MMHVHIDDKENDKILSYIKRKYVDNLKLKEALQIFQLHSKKWPLKVSFHVGHSPTKLEWKRRN